MQSNTKETKAIFLSIVIPVYNEEQSLPLLFREMDQLKEETWKYYWELEILMVNDGSTDGSWDIITQKCESDKDYAGINLSKNFGHQYALTAGIEMALGEVVVTMDADLQDPPSLIAEMVSKYKEGYDVVHTTRIKRGKEPLFKKITANSFYFLIEKISNVKLYRNTGDFRLISRRALTQLAMMKETHRFLRGLIPWIGYPQTQVFFNRKDRIAGDTHYSLVKMMLLAFDGIASMSTAPLRLAYLLSAFLFTIFIGYIVSSAFKYFFLGIELVPGWASMMSAITIFGTINLLLLGIIGDYIGRIYEQTKNRPLYIISEIKRKKE